MVRTVLDLTGCNSWHDMHERFRVALHFPDYYGCNWDAFWDSIDRESDVEFIEIRGEHTMPPEFAASLNMLHKLLEEEKRERVKRGWPFDYVIID